MLIESKSLVVYGIFQELRDTFFEFCNCNLYRLRLLNVCVTFSSMDVCPPFYPSRRNTLCITIIKIIFTLNFPDSDYL